MPEKTTLRGVLNIDKPAGITSHDVVAHVRRLLATPPKVGHTGTLDPFATGVLLVVVGSATRLIQFTRSWDKEYEATLMLGATSDTDDITGHKTPWQPPGSEKTRPVPPSPEKIKEALQQFIGPIQQTPPAYSAVKIGGKKMYELARAVAKADSSAKALAAAEALAKAGERPPRTVTIYAIDLVAYTYPELILRIRCGSGTYIRALARDVGQHLGTGAFVSSLRRTRNGPFESKNSLSLDKLSTGIPQVIHSPSMLVSHLPSVILTSHNIDALRQGKAVPAPHIPSHTPTTSFIILDAAKQVVGVSTYDPTTTLLSPAINL